MAYISYRLDKYFEIKPLNIRLYINGLYIFLANKALELEKNGNKVIFSFEEAIGFMCSTQVLDKDGISALAQMVTMASFVYNNGKTMDEQLEEIYTKYGYHVTLNSYYICHEPLVIKRIFERIRNIRGENIVSFFSFFLIFSFFF